MVKEVPGYASKPIKGICIRTKLPTPLSRLPATQRLPAAGCFRAGITTLLHSRQFSGSQGTHLFFGNAETCLHLRHQGLFKTHKRCTTGSQKPLDFSSNGGIQGGSACATICSSASGASICRDFTAI